MRPWLLLGPLTWAACVSTPPPSTPAREPVTVAATDERPQRQAKQPGGTAVVRDAQSPPSETPGVPEAAEEATDEGAQPDHRSAMPSEPVATDPQASPSDVPSTSIGAVDDGSLRGGVPLPRVGPGFRFNPRRSDEARYGTRELVEAVMLAAAELPPGPPLMVNDIGLPDGGPIPQHGSHQAGRDVDILFFYRDRAGRPHPPIGVPVEPDLTGVDYRDLSDPSDDVPLRLDVPRTWAFMRALVTAAGDHLQRIFIVEHVRSALLAEARRSGADSEVVERFAMVTCQPGTPHDDHMHVRFYCTPEDMAEGCLDKPPTYPFRRAALAARGLRPALYRGRPDPAARAARTTSPEEARRRARKKYGRMHRDVIAFLERRKAWLKRQGPPRRYCR